MKLTKKLAAGVLAVVLCLTVFAGCSGSTDISSGPAAQDYPVTVNGVTMNKQPEGVVVLSQNLADVMIAANCEIYLKGKSADCTQGDLSVLSDMTIDDVDAIKNAGANLVLVETAPTDAQKQALESAGIQVAVLQAAASREDLERLYTQVGSLVLGGKTGYTKGQQASKSVLLSLDNLTRLLPVEETGKYIGCYLFDLNGTAATGDTMAGKLIEYAGMTNNFSDWTGGKVDLQAKDEGQSGVSANPLVTGNPDYIFCAVGLKEQILSAPAYQQIKAVQNKHVYEIDAAYMRRQGNTLIDAVGQLAGAWYPQILQGITLPSSNAPTPSSSPSSSGASGAASSSGTSSYDTTSAPPTKIAQEGVLQMGDTGEEVLRLQHRLDELGYMTYGAFTGEFGGATEQFVKDFQYINYGNGEIYDVNGIADAKTLALLYSDQAKPNPAS